MAFSKRLVLLLFFALFALPSAALAEVKLGLALKQGYYDYTYISDIDPNGLGAAVGFMKGDRIKQVNFVSIWFIGQGKRFLKHGLKKGKPFVVMVERDGSLQQVIVDVNKPLLTFPKAQGADKYSNCYFAPSAACISSFMTVSNNLDVNMKFSSYYNNVKTYVRLGETEKARASLERMKALFYNNSSLVRFHAGSVLETLSFLDLKADQRFFDYVYKHTSKTSVGDLLDNAQSFAKYGSSELGKKFLDDALKLIEKDPKAIRYNERRLGRTYAAFKKDLSLKFFAVSKIHNSEVKNQVLEAAMVYHLGNEDMRSAQKVQDIILNAPRTWSNKDFLLYVQMFNKMHNTDKKLDMLDKVLKQYDDNDGKTFIQTVLAPTVVQAIGANGQIHRARKYIEKHSSDPTSMMMSLAVEAANSFSSHGLAVQRNKDFPKLLNEIHALLKAKTPEQRNKLNKTTLRDFYVVLAAYLPANPSIRELDGLDFDKYRYGPIIKSFIEVRKYGNALQWTDVVEKKFGKTYKYGDIFGSLGGIASGEDMAKYIKHPQFKEQKNRFHSNYLDRLYLRGFNDRALIEFNQLDETNKISAIRGQAMFVAPCKNCDL